MKPEPFTAPTCGIANTDPLRMDADSFAAWIAVIRRTNPIAADGWTAKREAANAADDSDDPTSAEYTGHYAACAAMARATSSAAGRR
jgi:hypothetical protein